MTRIYLTVVHYQSKAGKRYFKKNLFVIPLAYAFFSSTTCNGIIKADMEYMQWIALDEDVALQVASLLVPPGSTKGPRALCAGGDQSPNFSADLLEGKQAGGCSCREAQEQHLLLLYLVCPCRVAMSQAMVLVVGFCFVCWLCRGMPKPWCKQM